jgi:deazaflavin-dependent oxidoreductase (nitroreductase family)
VHDNTARRLSRLHVIVYRFTGGVLGRRLVRNDMLLLTTRGCVTGKAHTVPLLYLRDRDMLVVVASWGGRPRDPDWYANLVAEPRAVVQVRSRIWAVRARTANTEEREKPGGRGSSRRTRDTASISRTPTGPSPWSCSSQSRSTMTNR